MPAHKKAKVVFMGTPDFAVPSLEFLARTEAVLAVVTKPDMPHGRNRQLKPQPVKLAAEKLGLPIYEVDSIRQSFVKKLSEILPDIIITAAYGKLLPEAILHLPSKGCINIHPSLLPLYRGPCPIEWSLINGEEITGVTSIYMSQGLDEGDIIVQKSLQIKADFTAGDLSKELSALAAEVLAETIDKLKRNEAAGEPQDEKSATSAPFLRRTDCLIDWGKDASDTHNLARGLSPRPGAYTGWRKGKNETVSLKIWKTGTLKTFSASGVPGEVVGYSPSGNIIVACGAGFAILKDVQVPNGRHISGAEFARGYHIKPGFRFCNSDI